MVQPISAQVKVQSVFVVHGRNLEARNAMFNFLRALELRPMEWSRALAMTGEASPYIGTVLETAFQSAQAIVVLLTPDEVVYLRREYAEGVSDPDLASRAQPRPNVLFEAGMAIGKNSTRTILVELGRVRNFSDILGRHALRIDNTAQKRQELAQRLITAGCAVSTDGVDWLTAGEFLEPRELDVSSTEAKPDHDPTGGRIIRRREVR